MARPLDYLTALTFFAAIFQQSPVGLPAEPYGEISPELAEVFQKTVWEVVADHPLDRDGNGRIVA